MEEEDELPEHIEWLVDTPLFIDDLKITQLHDVVSTPLNQLYVADLQSQDVGKTSQNTTSATVEVSGETKTGSLLDLLAIQGKIGGKGSGTHERQKGESTLTNFRFSTTPQRKLAQVIIGYNNNTGDNLHLNVGPTDRSWWDRDDFDTYPRPLVCLNLPSEKEVEKEWEEAGVVPYDGWADMDVDASTLPTKTKFVPMAAEFEDGGVIPLYDELETDREKPPDYPRKGRRAPIGELNDDGSREKVELETSDQLAMARRWYWSWFNKNFEAVDALEVIEQASRNYGNIRWINFRLPLTYQGHTLHLHIEPRGDYPAGKFAYHFIKRGHKHGMRLVGTIKTEPSMNVLGIYER